MSHPETPSLDPRPRGRHAGHGLRRHHDPHRLLLRPARQRDPACARAARGAMEGAVARGLHLPHHAGGRPAHPCLRPDARGDPGGLPELQGLHHQRPAAASQAGRQSPRLRAHRARHGEGRRRTAGSWWSTARTRTSSSSTTSASARKAGWTATNLHLVHTKLSELARLQAHHRARQGDGRGRCTSSTPPPGRAWRPSARRAPSACPSTARRCTSTPASTPSTTRRRAASAPTPIRRSSFPRTRRRCGTGSCTAGSRPSPPTSTRRASS